MNIPDVLRLALTDELAAIPQKSLAEATTRLSARYRADRSANDAGRLARSPVDSAAYAAYRLPATFAAVSAVLLEVRRRNPDWQPATLLDAGAGPGTVLWAASSIWPALVRATLLERERAMIDFGKRLASHASAAVLREATWQQCDLLSQWEQSPCDLVIMAYALDELPPPRLNEIIARLWSVTGETLVLVEPGTPAGFALILQARQQLIDAGGHIIAPCPHQEACPMPDNDWCHFAQRLARTPLHRQVKQSTLSYEDEKFSYVAFSRQPVSPITGRVIRHPQVRSGHIYLDLCTPTGLRHSIVTRKDRDAFREARDLRWGDAISEALNDAL
jgi:ribosomal protein RSM22 (predicted rRNA methylase)